MLERVGLKAAGAAATLAGNLSPGVPVLTPSPRREGGGERWRERGARDLRSPSSGQTLVALQQRTRSGARRKARWEAGGGSSPGEVANVGRASAHRTSFVGVLCLEGGVCKFALARHREVVVGVGTPPLPGANISMAPKGPDKESGSLQAGSLSSVLCWIPRQPRTFDTATERLGAPRCEPPALSSVGHADLRTVTCMLPSSDHAGEAPSAASSQLRRRIPIRVLHLAIGLHAPKELSAFTRVWDFGVAEIAGVCSPSSVVVQWRAALQ